MRLSAVLLGLVVAMGCGSSVVGEPGTHTPGGNNDTNNSGNSGNSGNNGNNNNDQADDGSNDDGSNDEEPNDDGGSNPDDPDDTPPPPPVDPIDPIFPADGFCNDSGVNWGWCEDFDGQGMGGPASFNPAASAIDLHIHSHMTMTGTMCETSGDCTPYVQGGSLFLNAEDGGFAMDVARVEQPFDFAGREGRVHYRSSMQGHARMHQNLHITPVISNTVADLRAFDKPRDGDALDIDFVGDGGQPFTVGVWRNGALAYVAYGNGPAGITPGVQHDIDVYVSINHLSVSVDGEEVFDSTNRPALDGSPFPGVGFTRGYVYFTQLAYNPCKDGFCGDAANTFLWDNLAFDGPSLPRNSLTPVGKKEVLFRAWNMARCSVKGIPADGPQTVGWYIDTWHVQVDANTQVSMNDITCVGNPGDNGQPSTFPTPYGQAFIDDLLFVER